MKRKDFLLSLPMVAAAIKAISLPKTVDLKWKDETKKEVVAVPGDTYKFYESPDLKANTGTVRYVKKMDRNTYKVYITTNTKGRPVFKNLVLFESDPNRPGYITSQYAVWENFVRMDYDSFIVKTLTSKGRLRININDTVVFFANAMAEQSV